MDLPLFGSEPGELAILRAICRCGSRANVVDPPATLVKIDLASCGKARLELASGNRSCSKRLSPRPLSWSWNRRKKGDRKRRGGNGFSGFTPEPDSYRTP